MNFIIRVLLRRFNHSNPTGGLICPAFLCTTIAILKVYLEICAFQYWKSKKIMSILIFSKNNKGHLAIEKFVEVDNLNGSMQVIFCLMAAAFFLTLFLNVFFPHRKVR